MPPNDLREPRALGVDLTDPATYEPGFPHDVFARLRDEEPVFRHEARHVPLTFWGVTKYDDVVAVSRDADTFSSAADGVLLESSQGGAELMMLNQDAPHHTRLRSIVNRGFTPKQVKSMEDGVRAAARRIIDSIAVRGECDFVTDVAAELPLIVIADLLGVPQEDRHRVFEWTNRMIGREDPEYGITLDEATDAAAEIFAYASELGERRLREPANDIVTKLLTAEIDGEKLEHMEFVFFFLLLAVAGNETTRNLLSGGLLALAEHPDQRARLMSDRDLLPSAVEEMLRWVSPVMSFRRTATRDTEIRGVPIAAGESVVLFYPSANRDAEHFPDPSLFDVGRVPNDHLAFGGRGPHHCLGANLARMEIRVLFEEILERIPDFELTADPSRLRSNLICGIKHLPIRFTPSG
ncbi:MAG: cytochrome P450 [Acidimicrobiia bacterium]|nr:cytochrome P450 [Acidimicrobiia bacterium]